MRYSSGIRDDMQTIRFLTYTPGFMAYKPENNSPYPG
jgi:hypothetical protein